MFSVHTTPEELKNAIVSGHFGFECEENSGKEITYLEWRHSLRKAPFSKRFSSARKRKANVFKFLRFKSVFEKLRFGDVLVWTVGLTVETKLRFQISPA